MAPEESAKSAAKREEEILAYWSEKKIFEKSLAKPAPKGEFVFYDGPPFATGLPHYGHILASTIKDAIPRYKTMRGYHVRRRWGWDCHGLPLENQIEKELGLETKRDIEKLGIAQFNDAARKAVLRYTEDWKKIIPRIGRWVDMENDYRTMDASYTESVWWAFKRLYDKGLVYEGFKSMHLCPRCGTTLSNFEVAQGYKDVTDLSVTVKLPVVGQENTYLLAWTTTPWTLPGNFAAAVHKDATYVRIKSGDEHFILAKERLSVIKNAYDIEKEFPGRDLVGTSYTPPFPYFHAYKMENKERAWKVYGADFVTMEDGTGIVHIAPAFGSDDLALAEREKLPIVHHVNRDGMFVDAVADFKGMQAKPKEDPQSSDVAVIKYLAHHNLLFAKEKITHSYPHCWRCETPLLNYAASSWFVSVTKFAPKLVSENKKIHWVPSEVGEKRFGNWLENSRDWAISRARFWGAPIPVWRNPKTKKVVVMGSREDLKKHVKHSGNRYLILRHGEAEHILKDLVSSHVDDPVHLTAKGKKQVRDAVSALGKVDMIVTSPFIRTRETAEIVREVLDLSESVVIVEPRLVEYKHGIYNRTKNGLMESELSMDTLFEKGPPEGESLMELRKRLGTVLFELERKHTKKTILIVGHGWPLAMLRAVARGATRKETEVALDTEEPAPGEALELSFSPFPHNENYELDFHRPYIDTLELAAADGTRLERVHDVFDCWFESGSMPYAQDHYPFKHDTFEPAPGWFRKGRGYPADFIAEGLDQTRGWFYSLLVLGTALFGKAPYRNVVVNGIVLAEDGQKMSKRLNNYPDPMEVVSRHGADALRYYLLSSPLMRAEDLNFSEKGVAEVASKIVGRLVNVLSFYEMYKGDVAEAATQSTHILDRWILSRLSETIFAVESGMEVYALDKAARPLSDFIDDLSTWYLRRSRDRLKGGEDAAHALATLRNALREVAIVSAPFIPFTAEYVYQKVNKNGPESVHLAEWPKVAAIDPRLIKEMEETRGVVSIGLEARAKANIKVRQPLRELKVKSSALKGRTELLQLIQDELNVKRVVIDESLSDPVVLDSTITDELREEGEVRDLIRMIQEMRKQMGLSPKDSGVLILAGGMELLEKHWEEIRQVTNLSGFEKGETAHVRKA